MRPDKLQQTVSLLRQILLLGGFLILGLFISSTAAALIFHGNISRESVITASIFQNVFAFILPALLVPWMSGNNPIDWIQIKAKGRFTVYLGIVIILFVSMPVICGLVELNESVHFPESMSGIEKILRDWEEIGASSGSLILKSGSVLDMLLAVLTVGILTGIGEEFFFRGGLQNILTRHGVSPASAIIISAIVFSALHFQFFGMVPRAILGIWFGWLYWRFGTIWTAVTAHALNNTLVVISSWAIDRGMLSENFEMFGVEADYRWICVFASMIATGLVIKYIILWQSKKA